MAKPRSKQDEIVYSLKRDIMTGKFKQGEILPTVSLLARKFGVGQGVVREAISTLKATGFIRVKRGRTGGVLVGDQALDNLTDRLMEQLLMGEVTYEEIYRLRMLLELHCCRTGTPSVDKDTVSRLRDVNAKLFTAKDFQEHTRLNKDFHMTIALMGENKLLETFLGLLLDFMGRAVQLIVPDFREMQTEEEHLPIIQAIESKDVERACLHLREHIEKGTERVQRMEKLFFSRAIRESLSNSGA